MGEQTFARKELKISEDWFLEFWTPGKVYTVVCVFAW